MALKSAKTAAGIQYYVIYAAAHELYLRREYQRAMGMAEAARSALEVSHDAQ